MCVRVCLLLTNVCVCFYTMDLLHVWLAQDSMWHWMALNLSTRSDERCDGRWFQQSARIKMSAHIWSSIWIQKIVGNDWLIWLAAWTSFHNRCVVSHPLVIFLWFDRHHCWKDWLRSFIQTSKKKQTCWARVYMRSFGK